MTKQEIFQDTCRNFSNFMEEIMAEMQSLSGFTDAQKLAFLGEIVAAKETYGRDASGFYLSFSTPKQTALLGVVDNILADKEMRLQTLKDEITAKRAILAE